MIFKYIFLFLGVFIHFIYSCTDFVLVNEKQNVVAGRSMEFAKDLHSQIVISPKGQKNTSFLKNNKPGLSWISKYAYVGVIAFGDETFVVDGMNEKGLSFGSLIMDGAKYPPLLSADKSNTINFNDVGAWLLSSFATIEEVKKAMQKINLWVAPIPQFKEILPLHLSFHDKSGKSMVIEFIDGKIEFLENPIGVLTNAPNFEWMMTNLRNYINLTALNKKEIDFDGSLVLPTGQGTGLLGSPGDWTPPSRFVRIALIKNFVQKTKTPEENRNLAFHILNTVDIPYGVVRDSDGESTDYTRWVVVKDLSEMKFFYRTYKDLSIKNIDFLQEAGKITKAIKISMI